MSIEITPTAGSPWRSILPAPTDVALENGLWCPMDRTVALLPELDGLVCASCGACWDQHGRHGRWLTGNTILIIDGHLVEHEERGSDAATRLRRLDRRLAAAIGVGAVCGFGYGTGRVLHPYAQQVPDELVLLLASLLAAAGAVALAVVLLARWWEARFGSGGRVNTLVGGGR